MPKRFTATEKWDDPWFRRLPVDFKSLWFFLCERCDHAGIWKVDEESLVYFVGKSFEKDEVFRRFNEGKERLTSLNCGSKWYVKEFAAFQYGELTEVNKVHRSVLSILKKEGAIKPLARGVEGAKDKDKDKDTDKDCKTNNAIPVDNPPWIDKSEHKTLRMLFNKEDDLVTHLQGRGFDLASAKGLAVEILHGSCA